MGFEPEPQRRGASGFTARHLNHSATDVPHTNILFYNKQKRIHVYTLVKLAHKQVFMSSVHTYCRSNRRHGGGFLAHGVAGEIEPDCDADEPGRVENGKISFPI